MTQNGKAPVEFDLDRYLRNSRKVDLSGIDWEAIPEHRLVRQHHLALVAVGNFFAEAKGSS